MSALKNIRERKGFSVSQLAARSGISGKTLLDYEEGRQNIPLAHAKLLAKALWVQMEDLMPPPGATPPPAPSPVPMPREVVQAPPRPAEPQQVQVSTSGSAYHSAAPPPAQTRPQSPARHLEVSRHPVGAGGHGPRSEKASRAPKLVPPLTEGQMQELMHLASRMDITQEQLEERIGKPLATLSRPDATDWVKRLRAIADEIAPAQKVKYGRWPEAVEDQEAAYLAKLREAGAMCRFRLFNGEEFSGTISDFTPYTISIHLADTNEEMVLRKLAIAYYRCQATDNNGAGASVQGNGALSGAPEQRQHNHARDDHHQSVDDDPGSNHIGQPDTPETDQMDEDRGI